MKLEEVKKKHGVETVQQRTADAAKPRRRYFWDQDTSAPENSVLPKSEPLLSQSALESVSKPLADREQSVSTPAVKPLADREQSVSTKTATVSKALAYPLAAVLADREQSVSTPLANLGFEELVGKERDLLLLVFEKCQSTGALESPIFTTEELCTCLKIGSARLRNLIFRLTQKEILTVSQIKLGRAAHRRFSLAKDLFQQIHLGLSVSRPLADREQTVSTPLAKALAKALAEAPCSSSNLNLSNTTTTDPTKLVSEGAIFWLSVPKNLDGLVSVKQLREFVRQGLVSEDVLQTSLDGFAFDLEKGAVKAKNGNPVAILIGAIKGGGYISQSYVTELKAALAEVEKTRAELHKIQAENVTEQLRVEFEAFREKFPEEAAKIKPSGKFLQSFEQGSVGYRMWLDAFRERQAAQNPAVGDAVAKENSSLNP